jgi:hypothetical protein
MPVPRIREVREALVDDLAGPVRAVEPVREHELERARLRLAEGGLGDDTALGRDPEALEHVERRVEGSVPGTGPDPDAAVPTAVVHLRGEHGLPERREARVAGEEVGAEPDPEAEVAEVHPPEQELLVDGDVGGHEPVELSGRVHARGRVIIRKPAGLQEEQRPDRVGPATLRPAPVRPLALEHPGYPSACDHQPAFALPRRGRLVEQVAPNLPADDRVAGEKPVDDRVVSRQRLHGASVSEED